jgi:hypothetical protein
MTIVAKRSMENRRRITLPELRVRLRLSQTRLASLSTVGRSTVWRAEHGYQIQYEKAFMMLRVINERLRKLSYESVCICAIDWCVQGMDHTPSAHEECAGLCDHTPERFSLWAALAHSELTISQVAACAKLSKATVYNAAIQPVRESTAERITLAINQLLAAHNRPPIPLDFIAYPTRDKG